MDWLKISLLAVIQGITEFLPVSSSGHLVLFKHVVGLEIAMGATLEIVLHAGTLVSILIFYRKRIAMLWRGVVSGERLSRRYAGLVVLGVMPAIVMGLSARHGLEGFYERPEWAGVFLLVTGGYLLGTSGVKSTAGTLRPVSAVWIGLAQMAALLPGISRSGSTICTARLFGIEPKKAAEFSFLMSIPLLVGAVLYEGIRWIRSDAVLSVDGWVLGWGFLLSAVVGHGALSWLVLTLERGRFWHFGIYCLGLGATSLWLLR